ncbi:hypothetical protein KCV02_g16280, partial [Aureobasidium melanogenum]
MIVSSRMFPTKATSAWIKRTPEQRLQMVGDYLHFAGWKNIEIIDIKAGDVANAPAEDQGGLQGFMQMMGMSGSDPLCKQTYIQSKPAASHRIASTKTFPSEAELLLDIAMPLQLLPASAAAFAPRSAPTIVLGSRVETWLTQTLKRISRVKRPLNSVPQHYRFLTETLGAPSAIWLLSSLMLPNAPNSELRKDSDPLREAIANYTLTPVQAYVVHVDMVSQHEVAFKLTQETIDALIDYHNDIYSVDIAASTYTWPEKDDQIKKMQEAFVQAVNRFVYRTSVRALEGLEDEGAGELLEGRSDDVKTAIMNLFLPLLPPPPQIVDLIAPAPIMPNSS